MALEIRQPGLQPLHQIAEGFSYGRAQAKMTLLEDANRNSRVIARKLGEIVAGLHLNIGIPENRRVINHDNGNAFAEAQVGGETHFLMVRSPIDGRSFEEQLGGEKPDITIVSGPCLFSADGVKAVGHSGEKYALTRRGEAIAEPIHRIHVDPELSVYEIEAITRLGTFISGLKHDNSHIKRVELNIPEAEYYLYALDGYREGHLSPGQLKGWFDVVDQRHKRQIKLLSSRIQRRRQVQIVESSPLASIKHYMRQTVAKGQMPTYEEARTILAGEDALWRDILAVAPTQSWQDIIDLSYVHAELSAAEQKAGHPTYAVIVENPTENKIFANAKRVAEALQQKGQRVFHAVALYPHEHIIPSGDNATRTMYHIDEERGRKFSLARQIIGLYRRGRSA
ncbi:MAG TPA: hypothetical protein VFQ63_03825 [Patescibacteria group bacterium]|nr:hypothetical protein [Patescibacteria group bacterium]